jgi:hypothetical protein
MTVHELVVTTLKQRGDVKPMTFKQRQTLIRQRQPFKRGFDQGFIVGIGYAIAEIQRGHDNPTILVDVARAAGLSFEDFEKAGLDEYDLKVLREHLPRPRKRKRAA